VDVPFRTSFDFHPECNAGLESSARGNAFDAKTYFAQRRANRQERFSHCAKAIGILEKLTTGTQDGARCRVLLVLCLRETSQRRRMLYQSWGAFVIWAMLKMPAMRCSLLRNSLTSMTLSDRGND